MISANQNRCATIHRSKIASKPIVAGQEWDLSWVTWSEFSGTYSSMRLNQCSAGFSWTHQWDQLLSCISKAPPMNEKRRISCIVKPFDEENNCKKFFCLELMKNCCNYRSIELKINRRVGFRNAHNRKHGALDVAQIHRNAMMYVQMYIITAISWSPYMFAHR